VSSKVAAVVNFFGPSDFLAIIGQPGHIDSTRSDDSMAKLLGGGLHENPEKAKAASPITYVTANDPPVLTVHGTKDRKVPYDQAVRMDATLRKAGVVSYFITVKGGGHGFGTVADGRVKAFFDKYLRGKDVEISTEPLNKP
jgi:dipeptidyl aminopeptidase/acylaminoacyl peptidase